MNQKFATHSDLSVENKNPERYLMIIDVINTFQIMQQLSIKRLVEEVKLNQVSGTVSHHRTIDLSFMFYLGWAFWKPNVYGNCTTNNAKETIIRPPTLSQPQNFVGKKLLRRCCHANSSIRYRRAPSDFFFG